MGNVDIMKYLGLGAGAVALPVILNKIAEKVAFISTIVNHEFMSFSIVGITVGGILLASAGIGLVDYFVFNK